MAAFFLFCGKRSN